MDYEEKLLDQRWRDKRLEILKRDHHQCQKCGNKEISQNSQSGQLKSLELDDNKLTALLNENDPRFRLENPKYRIVFETRDKKTVSSYICLRGWNNQLNDFQDVVVYYSLEEDFSEPSKKILMINGLKNGNDKLADWLYVGNLHVHHKYYLKSKEPWQYPKDALNTLCWNCHIRLHKNNEVPVYNENGKEVYSLTPCARCHGVGEFPQYKHVQNGICFRCSGAKYEELI